MESKYIKSLSTFLKHNKKKVLNFFKMHKEKVNTLKEFLKFFLGYMMTKPVPSKSF